MMGFLLEKPPRLISERSCTTLTEKGKDLLTFTVSLAQWSERWDQKESIKFITKSSGKPVERVTLRSASGEKVRHDDVVVAQGRAKSSELSAIRKILANRVPV